MNLAVRAHPVGRDAVEGAERDRPARIFADAAGNYDAVRRPTLRNVRPLA